MVVVLDEGRQRGAAPANHSMGQYNPIDVTLFRLIFPLRIKMLSSSPDTPLKVGSTLRGVPNGAPSLRVYLSAVFQSTLI